MVKSFARLVSVLLHPFVLAVGALVVVLQASGLRRGEWTNWFFLTLGITVIPLLARLLLRYRKFGSDFDIFHRHQRGTVYALAALCLLALVLIVTIFAAPAFLRAVVYAAFVAVLVAALINRLSKISVHAMLMAGGAVVTGSPHPRLWPVMVALTLLQGWSRVYLGKHTVTQVLLGWLVGAGAVAGTLYAFAGPGR